LRPQSWRKALLLGVAAGVGMEAMELFVTLPLLARWLGRMPDLSDFADMVGNLKVFLIYLVLVWTLGALGEEIDYRRPPRLEARMASPMERRDEIRE
jgi:CAAX protease family protein